MIDAVLVLVFFFRFIVISCRYYYHNIVPLRKCFKKGNYNELLITFTFPSRFRLPNRLILTQKLDYDRSFI